MTYPTKIDYEVMLQNALKHLMASALRQVVDSGLPGEHHFFIGFDTQHVGVSISDRLKKDYPEEMVIVLRHQYENLWVEETEFGVDLFFGGVRESLHVPFAAVTRFEDPSANFALQFVGSEELTDDGNMDLNALEDELLDDLEDENPSSEGVAKFPNKKIEAVAKVESTDAADDDSKVVSLDHFRKS